MKRFLSIPVNSGDSFYLERSFKDGFENCLVDAGKGSLQGVSLSGYLLSKNISRLNVLLVTHNDNDHSYGAFDILMNIKVDEVYLPALWFDRIDDVISKPRLFFEELLRNLDRSGEFSLDELSEFTDPRCTQLNLKKIEDLMMILSPKVRNAIKSLSNILRIYLLARVKKVRIRWFEFDDSDLSLNQNSLKSLKYKLLIPINCRHIKMSHSKSRYSALKWLKLTMENKRALVFSSKDPDMEEHDLIFTSDSLLNFQLPKLKAAISTVPHHGRKSNEAALRKLVLLKAVSFFVRNSHNKDDHKYLSPSFLRLKPSVKFCDTCTRQSHLGAQEVSFSKLKSVWALSNSARNCSC